MIPTQSRDPDALPVWSGADLQRYADSAVRVELDRRHDAALGPNAIEIITDVLTVLDAHNITPDDIPCEVSLGRIVLLALASARNRIDQTPLPDELGDGHGDTTDNPTADPH